MLLIFFVLALMMSVNAGPCKVSEMPDMTNLWPTYRHDAWLTGFSPLKGGLEQAPEELWKIDLGGKMEPVESARLEDLDGDGEDELLRILPDRLICQSIEGEKIWELGGMSRPRVIDIRDYSGNGKTGIRILCNSEVQVDEYMINGETGKKAHLYTRKNAFGGHERTGHIVPGVPGEQICLLWDGTSAGQNYGGGNNQLAHIYLWSFEKGPDQPTLRFQTEISGTIYDGQHLYADMDGDGQREFVVVSHEQAWLFDPETARQKGYFKWLPEIRTKGMSYIAAVPLKKGELPSLLMINPYIPGVQIIKQDVKTCYRLWKKVVAPVETQYQPAVKIGSGAPDPFLTLNGDDHYFIATAITNEHGDGKTALVIFDSLNGLRLFEKPDTKILTVDDLDGDGWPEVLLQVNDLLRIANWTGNEFKTRWEGHSITPLLTPAPPENNLNRNTNAGVNTPLWREKPGVSDFLLRFTDGVHSCRLTKENGLSKGKLITEHEALNNQGVTAAKPRNYEWNGKKLVTHLNGKTETSYEIPMRRAYLAPPPIVGRFGGEIRVITRDAEGRVLSLSSGGGDQRQLLEHSPASPKMLMINEPVGALVDLDGDGENELLASTIGADGKPAVVGVDGKGTVKLRIEPFDGAIKMTYGPTGSLGKDLGRWVIVCFHYNLKYPIMAAYETKTGRQLWTRDGYGNKFSVSDQLYPHLPTAIYDFDGDGADDLVLASENYYGIISVKDNRDLIGPVTITASVPGHWPAYGTPLLADFLHQGKPQILLSRAYELFFFCTLEGHPIGHFGTTRDTMPRGQCAIADLDGDGKLEAVMAQPDGLLRAFDATPLNEKCPTCAEDTPLQESNHGLRERWTYRLPGFVGIDHDFASADLDGDGKIELLIGCDDGRLYALKEIGGKCRELWNVDLAADVGSPILADLEGNGVLSILVPTADGFLYCLGPKSSSKK